MGKEEEKKRQIELMAMMLSDLSLCERMLASAGADLEGPRKDDAMMIMLMAQHALNYHKLAGKKLTDEDKLIFGEAPSIADALKKEGQAKTEALKKYAENFRTDLLDIYGTEDKAFKNFKEAPAAANSFEGYFAEFKTSDLLPLMKDGSPEARELKNEILSMRSRLEKREELKYEDFIPMYEKAVNYLSLKPSAPRTGDGKKRAQAAYKIIGNIGLQVGMMVGGDFAERVQRDVKRQMIRSKTFRDHMSSFAQSYIQTSGTQYKHVPDNDIHILNSTKFVEFAGLCDKALDGKDFSIKINSKEAADRMDFMVSKIDERIEKANQAPDKEFKKILLKSTEEQVRENRIIAEGNAALSYAAQATNKKMFFPDRVNEKGAFTNPLPERHGLKCNRGAALALAAVQLMRDGHSIKDIFDPSKLQEERIAAGKIVLDRIENASDQEYDYFVGESCAFGLEHGLKEINAYLNSMPEISGHALFTPENRFLIPTITMMQDLGQEIERADFRREAEASYSKEYVADLLSLQAGGTSVLQALKKGYEHEIYSLSGEAQKTFRIKNNGELGGVKNYLDQSFGHIVAGEFANSYIKGMDRSRSFFEEFRLHSPAQNGIGMLAMSFTANEELKESIRDSFSGDMAQNIKTFTKKIMEGNVITTKTLSNNLQEGLRIKGIEKVANIKSKVASPGSPCL